MIIHAHSVALIVPEVRFPIVCLKTAIFPQLNFITTPLHVFGEYDLFSMRCGADQRGNARPATKFQYTSCLRVESVLLVEIMVAAKVECLILLVANDSVWRRKS